MEKLSATQEESIISKMIERWKLSDSAESSNRANFLEDMNFAQGGEYQWDKETLGIFDSGNRPHESYNQIPQFINQITNDMRMNMAQTRFIPNDDDHKEKADVMEDLARAIQSDSDGEIAYDTAATNQVTGGWGYWRYITQYEDESDIDNDNQVIKIKWIPNPLMVFDDPNCTDQDRLDREWLIHAYDMPKGDFKGKDGHGYDKITIQSIGDNAPEWATSDTIRVAEYWTVEKTYETAKNKNGNDRKVCKKRILWRKCTAKEVLEEKEFPGDYIPYVFVAGNQFFIDGKQILTGIVKNMKSAQIQYNRWTNHATELVSMAPLSPFILDPDQIAGYEPVWDTANVKKYSYLPAKTFDPETDKQFSMPQRAQNGADIGSILALVDRAQQNFYVTTGMYPASLGQVSNEKSGRAIMARQREGDVSTFHFADNMARAQRAGGRILAKLIPAIYDGSRIVKGIREDRTTRMIKINQPFEGPRKEVKEYDLTTGTYDVMVTTGPSFTTKRQESADAMMSLAGNTNLMEIAPDLFYGSQDWPGADKIAERYKRTLPPEITQDEEERPEIPPQLIQQIQQMEQIIQELDGELNNARAEIESGRLDLAKKQADLEGQLAKNDQTYQSRLLASEARTAKAELQRQEMDLRMRERDIENEVSALNQARQRLIDQNKFNNLVKRLAEKDLTIKSIAEQRKVDAANEQLQEDYVRQMQEYDMIMSEINEYAQAIPNVEQEVYIEG